MRRAAVAAFCVLACGGGGDVPPPAEPPGAAPQAGEPAAVAGIGAQDTAAGQPGTGLVRELFAYRAAGRDPFRSLLASGEVRPLIEDLRLVGVYYDARYPARSVAVLRDVSVNKRYDVRVEDELGRLRVLEIRADEVIFLLEEFGVQRQVSLAVRRRQEGIP